MFSEEQRIINRQVNKIYLMGAFPPPVQGMANVNQFLFEELTTAGFKVEKLNTSPPTLKRNLFTLLNRLLSIIHAWFCLLKSPPGKSQLYIAVSGGWGQLYDVVSLTIARLKHMRCILHHHSFLYLRKKRFISQFLMWIAGKQATHIILCNEMAKLLKENYAIEKTFLLSNLTFFPTEGIQNFSKELSAIGFLSNISKEKGGEILVDLAYAINSSGLDLRFIVAGPCHEDELTRRLQHAVLDGVLEWCGAIYGEEKKKFWKDIDVFILPSMNEAEPLVIWEGLAVGIPAISNALGCIPDQIGDAGMVVPLNDNFISRTIKILENWYTNPDVYEATLQKVMMHYNNKHKIAELQWEKLVKDLQRKV